MFDMKIYEACLCSFRESLKPKMKSKYQKNTWINSILQMQSFMLMNVRELMVAPFVIFAPFYEKSVDMIVLSSGSISRED